MIVTTHTSDGVKVSVSSRMTKQVQIELAHDYLDSINRARMSPTTARAIAGDLLEAAKAVEAQDIVEMEAGAGGQMLASPQRP